MYTYTYIYTLIHIYIYTFIHIYIFTYVHIYIYTYIHIYISTYIHIYIYTYIHIHTHTHIHIYIFTYKHIYIYIYIYTHTFIHIYIFTYIHIYIKHVYIYTYIHRYTYTYIHIHIYNGNIHAYLFYKIQFQWPQSPICLFAIWRRTWSPHLQWVGKGPPDLGNPMENTGKHMEIQWKNMKIQWKNMETQWRNKCFEHDLNGMLWKLSSNQCWPPAPFFPNPEKPQKTVVQWRICMKKQHRPRGSSIFREKKWLPTSSNPHSKVYVSDDGDDTGSIFGFPV